MPQMSLQNFWMHFLSIGEFSTTLGSRAAWHKLLAKLCYNQSVFPAAFIRCQGWPSITKFVFGSWSHWSIVLWCALPVSSCSRQLEVLIKYLKCSSSTLSSWLKHSMLLRIFPGSKTSRWQKLWNWGRLIEKFIFSVYYVGRRGEENHARNEMWYLCWGRVVFWKKNNKTILTLARTFLSFNRMERFIGMCFLTDVSQVSDSIKFCCSWLKQNFLRIHCVFTIVRENKPNLWWIVNINLYCGD